MTTTACHHCGKSFKRLSRLHVRCNACYWAVKPIMSRAHNAVRTAIARGELQSLDGLPCVDCGGKSEHYDHRDYTKPLDVQPVCRVCNYRRGPAITGAPA